FVGIEEEVLARGFIIRTMAQRRNKKWLIYDVSAVIFSAMHLMNANVTLAGLLNIVLVGLLFAYMFDVTKSLWMPIGFHMMWNYFQGVVFGFPVSGMSTSSVYPLEIKEGQELWTG